MFIIGAVFYMLISITDAGDLWEGNGDPPLAPARPRCHLPTIDGLAAMLGAAGLSPWLTRGANLLVAATTLVLSFSWWPAN